MSAGNAESWRQNTKVFFAVGAPQLLWLCVFFIVPLLTVWTLSFSVKTGVVGQELTWTTDNYARAFEPIYLGIFGKSFFIAGMATLLCLFIGYPIALMIAFAPQRLKMILLFAVTVPFWINILIRTYALIAVFRARGFLNFTLEWFWDIGAGALASFGIVAAAPAYAPLEILYSNTAVIFGIVYVFLPFMILPLYAAMERFDKSYLEASLDLGASHWRTFCRVLLPMTLPGVLSGVIIVFVPALGAFFVADMLGGADSQLVGNVIERQFLGANNWPFGAALSFLLMYITFVAIVARGLFARRGGAI